jgi:hypothetical protein
MLGQSGIIEIATGSRSPRVQQISFCVAKFAVAVNPTTGTFGKEVASSPSLAYAGRKFCLW